MKNDKVKVVTIGGGSSYTPELIEGFILRHNQLPVDELWLVDIEEGKEKLDIITKLGQRMIEKAGVAMKIISSLDRREALIGADFVTTQMRIGLIDARIQDERIPNSLGLIGQETNGAGGAFNAFRTIPVILDIVKDIQELCPNAWMLNFTNPAGMITEAIAQYSDYKKAIGLCNVPIGMANSFAKLMKADLSQIRLEIQGSNHFIFVTNVFLDGISVFDDFMKAYLNKSEDMNMKNISGIDFSEPLIKGLGVIPCSYHNYYFHQKEQVEIQKKEFKENAVRGQVVKKAESELFEFYKDESLCVKPQQLEQRGGALYSDAACNLISSIYNNTGDVQYLNIVNNGTISDLPKDCVIETACMVTSAGPIPLNIGELKPEISGYIHHIKAFEKLCVKAGAEGCRDTAIAALNLNPLIGSDALAIKVFDLLYEAHKKYLPHF